MSSETRSPSLLVRLNTPLSRHSDAMELELPEEMSVEQALAEATRRRPASTAQQSVQDLIRREASVDPSFIVTGDDGQRALVTPKTRIADIARKVQVRSGLDMLVIRVAEISIQSYQKVGGQRSLAE